MQRADRPTERAGSWASSGRRSRPRREALWLGRADTLAALDGLGPASATELTRAVPALAEQFAFGEGKRYAGTFGLSTRLLFLLAAEWKIIRARPRGSWVSGQYRWARLEAWAPDLPVPPSPADARVALVGRWLAAFGPATERDLAWWSGLPLGQLRAALAALEVTTVRLDDGDGLALADDLELTPEPEAGAVLLPSLDSTPMGWKLRDWFLGPHGGALFDTNGNIGPSVWWAGAIVGGWGQRPMGRSTSGCSRTSDAKRRRPSRRLRPRSATGSAASASPPASRHRSRSSWLAEEASVSARREGREARPELQRQLPAAPDRVVLEEDMDVAVARQERLESDSPGVELGRRVVVPAQADVQRGACQPQGGGIGCLGQIGGAQDRSCGPQSSVDLVVLPRLILELHHERHVGRPGPQQPIEALVVAALIGTDPEEDGAQSCPEGAGRLEQPR
jgi:hypothetical protein